MCATMSIFSIKLVILHFTFCCFTAKGKDVALECPHKWRNGCKVSLYCSLQTVNFNPTVCIGLFIKKAEFLLKGNGAKVASPECAVDFSTSCDGTFSKQGCACTSLVRNVYTFQHTLVVTSKLVNASWFCESQCLDAGFDPALSTSRSDTCSNTDVIDFILEWLGIALLCVGTALVIVGIIMIIAFRLAGIAGKIGIAVGCVGLLLLIAGSALMTVAYIDDEPAGIAFLWVGSVLLIFLGIGISITVAYIDDKPDESKCLCRWSVWVILLIIFCIYILKTGKGDPGSEHQKQTPRPEASDGNPPISTENDAGNSAANNKQDPCLKRDFTVRAKVGTGLMCVGGILAIIGGIVAATEPCPSDCFPTTLQEILGLVLAVIGFVVFVVKIIIEIVALKKTKTKPGSS